MRTALYHMRNHMPKYTIIVSLIADFFHIRQLWPIMRTYSEKENLGLIYHLSMSVP